MDIALFRQHFNEQALAIGAALQSKGCCYFQRFNACARAIPHLENAVPSEETGFSQEQLAGAALQGMQGSPAVTARFVTSLLQVANQNALELSGTVKPAQTGEDLFREHAARLDKALSAVRCCYFQGGAHPLIAASANDNAQQAGLAFHVASFVEPLIQIARSNAKKLTPDG